MPNRIEVRVGFFEQEQHALATRDTNKPKHYEELALSIRELGEAHVPAGVVYPRHLYVHVTEQVGDVDRFQCSEHVSIIRVGTGKAPSAAAGYVSW